MEVLLAVTLALIKQHRFLKLRNTTYWTVFADFSVEISEVKCWLCVPFLLQSVLILVGGGQGFGLRMRIGQRLSAQAEDSTLSRKHARWAHRSEITNNWTCPSHRYPHQSLQKIAFKRCMRCNNTKGEQNTDRNQRDVAPALDIYR